jgi:energy-coupling factor transporter ATP-binding protein EcfA2
MAADKDTGLPVIAESTDQELLKVVLAHYTATLKADAGAQGYLARRKLSSGELLDHFQLGFVDRSLGLKLPQRNRKAGRAIREQLQRLGLLRDSGHETFRGAVTVPLFDAQGQVVQFYGRMVGHGLRPGVPLHLWLPGQVKGLVNPAAFEASKTIIVASSVIDALTWWCAGHKNAVAGSIEDVLAAIQAHGTEKVYLAFRRRPEGDKAAEDVTKKLVAIGVEVHRVLFRLGMDANDLAQKADDPSQALGDALRSATWVAKREAAIKPPVAPEAQPVPSQPATSPESTNQGDELTVTVQDRRYRVRGLGKNTGLETLKVNLLVSRGDKFHVDVLDLYQAKQRAAFIKQASHELCLGEDVLRQDLAKLLFKLEEVQEALLKNPQAPVDGRPELTEADKAAALDLLRDPRLLDRIATDIEKTGLVGERTNALTAYLGVVSRKLDRPLALLVRSSSGSGKSSLMEAVLGLVPDEDKLTFSSLTTQALYYIGETNLQHRVLAVAEDQGTAKVAYPLKLLLSEGSLTIGSTTKDDRGRLVSETYKVQGPTALFFTSTAAEVDEELVNRCLVLTIDESREQTRAVHASQRQRETLESLQAAQEREQLKRLHQNAQRLLRPLKILNPYAERLTFSDAQTRMRRDFPKYLALIKAIALLHQHQRQLGTTTVGGEAVEYIEVQAEDIEQANALCHDILGQSLDELPPQARRLLTQLDQMAAQGCQAKGVDRRAYRFGRREVRSQTGWSDFQVRTHLARLVQMELVVVHHGGRGQLFEYELLWDGQEPDGRHMLGLIDLKALAACTTAGSRGGEARFEPPSSPHRGAIEPGSRVGRNGDKPSDAKGLQTVEQSGAENAKPGGVANPASNGQPADTIATALQAVTGEVTP